MRAVESVDIAGDQQQIGVDQRGGRCGEIVVVAELELFDRDRIVLVDHRHAAEPQQFEQRIARIEIAAAVAQVVMGEQHLRHRRVDQALPQRDHARLAERRECLAANQTALARIGRDACTTGGDGARRHEHDFAPCGARGGNEVSERSRIALAQLARIFGQQAAADLEHRTFPRRQRPLGETQDAIGVHELSSRASRARNSSRRKSAAAPGETRAARLASAVRPELAVSLACAARR